jgi:hypothetical protein
MRAGPTLGGIVLLVLAAPRAEASPSAKLVYVRGAGAEVCPPEADLRQAVAVRLGYDPFFPAASKTVVAQISRVPKGFRGRVQIVGDDGNVRGERDIATTGDDCGELTSAIALAVSIALDDLDEPSPSGPPDPPAPAAEPIPPAATPSPEPARAQPREGQPTTKPSPTATRMELTGSVGPTISIGTAPVVLGAGVALGLQFPRVAARLDVRAEHTFSQEMATGGQVSTDVALAIGSLCLRFGLPFACAGGGAGIIWSHTEGLARPASDRALVPIMALRLGVQAPLGARFYLEPSIEAGGNFTPQRVVVDGRSGYEVPALWGVLGVHVGGKIF